ncbi:porin [Methylorubrum populi]|uniref:Porin n=1 Tax=Methylorubrum populi TaxID=223967 RepID=A0A160PH38_9HYPH|nr:porin [Methylorubrum populi]BAU92116.1 porin [Methylorubrum populi]
MKLVKSLLLGSAAGLTIVGGAQAADLPVKKAVPIEYVRVCSAYGAGFFYIPGTDTCLRVSGRARAEYGYIGSDSRRVTGGGDLSGFTGLARFNLDARTQTSYGTLRAFLRLDAASRTGHTKLSSGTNLRGGYAFSGTGQDAFGRIQNFINVDKAFIQFAGLTAGRASSFYDFYAADYEIIGSSLGSNMPSTNLLAYTQKFGDGWTATISMEDPNYRKNPLFTNAVPAAGAAAGTGALSTVLTTAPTPIILGTDALGNATSVAFIDAVQRSRLPDFVGSLRYDAPWGSAQLSAAVREINVGGFLASVGVPGGSAAAAQSLLAARGLGDGVKTEYGWAVQGGVKFNLPFIAPGDGLYLQGSYGEGTSFYTGINRFTAGYLANASVYAGNPFNQYLADAVVNPLSGRIELSSSFTAVASYLHYWSPEWRSAFYASYGEIWFPTGARQATSQANALVNSGNTVAPGSYLTNPVGYATSQSLRDTYQIVTGASLIWSPVKDLDIGIEGQYIRTGVKSGRVADQDKGGFIGSGNAQVPTRTVSSEDVFQARFRVQRDF